MTDGVCSVEAILRSSPSTTSRAETVEGPPMKTRNSGSKVILPMTTATVRHKN